MADWELDLDDDTDVTAGMILLKSLSLYALNVNLCPAHRRDREQHAIEKLDMDPELVREMSDGVLLIACEDEYKHIMIGRGIPESFFR